MSSVPFPSQLSPKTDKQMKNESHELFPSIDYHYFHPKKIELDPSRRFNGDHS